MESAINHLRYRLKNVYKALGRTLPERPERCAPFFLKNERGTFFHQDFRNGLDDDAILKVFEDVFYETAHIEDPLKKVLGGRGENGRLVDQEIERNRDLALCVDLANWFKHGRSHHGRTKSKCHPIIKNVDRVCRIQTNAAAESMSGITYSWDQGQPKLKSFGGPNVVVFEGDVVDEDGTRLGDAMEIANRAVSGWEKILRDLSII